LYLAGANPEELMDNKYTRSQGFFDPSWAGFGSGTNYFQSGGGLNLRGYAGYLAPQKDKNGNLVYTYKGNSGAAINTEIEFDKLLNSTGISFTRHLNLPLIYSGCRYYQLQQDRRGFLLSDIRADAGVGFTLGVMKWGLYKWLNH